MNIDTEKLNQLATISGDMTSHLERAYMASMTQDNGQSDIVEATHQLGLADKELQKIVKLMWHNQDATISEIFANQRAEINGLRSIFDLNEMD